MNFKDIKTCMECGGDGIRSGLFYNGINCQTYIICPHCKGTGLEPVRTKLDVPDGYEFLKENKGELIFYNIDAEYDKGIWCLFIPHPIGTILELVCDECGGRVCEDCGCMLDDNGDCSSWMAHEETYGGEDWFKCPSCKGNPVKKVKLKDVAVDGDTLLEYWEEESNE